tara:strand:- start:295 stop:585 length:291 start_codon:yes stop_codon:yes gene_type:complete
MTANPTPGPWTQGSNYEVVASDGTNICKVHNDEGQGAANARLIAKVPAMLDALRKAIAVINDFMPNIANCSLDDYAALNEVLVEAPAILARIGETP